MHGMTRWPPTPLSAEIHLCKLGSATQMVRTEQQYSPPSYMTAADFLEGAEDCQLVLEVFEELEAESADIHLNDEGGREGRPGAP